jgi:hypothetical protein
MYISPSENGNEDEPIVNVYKAYRQTPLPLAVVPIPENVKDFESIKIWFVFTIKFLGYKFNYYCIQRFRGIRHSFSARISPKFPVRQCEHMLL